jgi:AbrB family looped-hinge helix DNA binding protein
MAHSHERAEVRLGPQGRLVVPAPLRKRLGVEVGDTMIARVEDDRLVLEKRDAIIARLHAQFQAIPADVDLAAELIQERRAEAQRDARS